MDAADIRWFSEHNQ